MTCETCGKVFRSESGFDGHRAGVYEKGHMVQRRVQGKRRMVYIVDSPNTRRCLSDKEMRARGYFVNQRGQLARAYGGRVAA